RTPSTTPGCDEDEDGVDGVVRLWSGVADVPAGVDGEPSEPPAVGVDESEPPHADSTTPTATRAAASVVPVRRVTRSLCTADLCRRGGSPYPGQQPRSRSAK